MKGLRMIFPAMLLAMTGCFAMTLPGPNGPERIYPVSGSMRITMYNYCAPILVVAAPHHRVEIPFGQHRPVEYPAIFGENMQNEETVFTALSAERGLLGSAKQSFSPDNSSIMTYRQVTIGGNDLHIQGRNGSNVC
jgi:hypothetical protein